MMDLNECLGCYIDNYCNYIANMFNIRPGVSFWLQPRLFLFFLAACGTTMTAIGLYIYFELGNIYPYNFIAAACLTEAAIYLRFMRMIVCPAQIYVFLVYYTSPILKILGIQTGKINNEILYRSFETVIVMFAAQIYAFAVINLTI